MRYTLELPIILVEQLGLFDRTLDIDLFPARSGFVRVSGRHGDVSAIGRDLAGLCLGRDPVIKAAACHALDNLMLTLLTQSPSPEYGGVERRSGSRYQPE